MLGPFATTNRLTPIHQMLLAVLSCAACASMSTTSTTTTTTTRDRGGPLWPHGMGPISYNKAVSQWYIHWWRAETAGRQPALTLYSRVKRTPCIVRQWSSLFRPRYELCGRTGIRNGGQGLPERWYRPCCFTLHTNHFSTRQQTHNKKFRIIIAQHTTAKQW